jgi:hypothetical protein
VGVKEWSSALNRMSLIGRSGHCPVSYDSGAGGGFSGGRMVSESSGKAASEGRLRRRLGCRTTRRSQGRVRVRCHAAGSARRQLARLPCASATTSVLGKWSGFSKLHQWSGRAVGLAAYDADRDVYVFAIDTASAESTGAEGLGRVTDKPRQQRARRAPAKIADSGHGYVLLRRLKFAASALSNPVALGGATDLHFLRGLSRG